MSGGIPLFDLGRLHSVGLDVSEIHAECFVWTSPRNHRQGGLISFEGGYRHGSDGKDDALLIRWKLQQLMDLQRIDGLVIDCTRLRYEWGDDLDLRPPQKLLSDGQMPLLVVLQPAQTDAFRYVVPEQLHRTHLRLALSEMADTLRKMRSIL